MKALFAGSFDPFTIGHKDIVLRALDLFNEIVIGIGFNPLKKSFFPIEKRLESIKKAFLNTDKVKVMEYQGLTVDFAKKIKADVLLRGIRNISDFESEKNLADINRELAGLETFLLFVKPEYAYVSSSMVRELYLNKKDITAYLGSPLF